MATATVDKNSKKKRNPGGGSKPGERRGGRVKGTPNKVTKEVKEAIAKIAEENVENFEKWLEEVAEHDPAKACDIFLKVIEYHIPKLQRTDLTSGNKPLPKAINVNILSGGNSGN